MRRLFAATDSSLSTRTAALMLVRAIAFALSFALPMVIVRRLSVTEFGLYKQAFLVVGSAMVIMPLGFAMSAYYFLPRETERRGAVVFNILLFNTAVGACGCLALVLFPQLLAAIFNDASLVTLAPVIGVVVLFATAASFLEIAAVANQETAWASAFIVATNVTRTILLVAAALLFGTVTALLYAALLHSVLQFLALLAYLWSRFPGFWRRFDVGMMRAQLSYALPLGASSVLYVLQNDMHYYFVSREFGAAAFALYAVGCFHLPIIGILGSSAGSVLIPRVSAMQKDDDKREMVLLTARVMRKLAAIYLPLWAFLLVMGREVLAFLFTAEYVASWPILVVSLLFLPLDILISDPVLRAHANLRFLIMRVKIAVFLTVLLILAFKTATLEPVGVILVVVAANVVERIFGIALAYRILGTRPRDLGALRDVSKLAGAACVAAVAAYAIRLTVGGHVGLFVTLLTCGVVFVAVYIAAALATRVPTVEERRAVRHAIARLKGLAPPHVVTTPG